MIKSARDNLKCFQISEVDLGGTKYTFLETSDEIDSESDVASASEAASEAIVTKQNEIHWTFIFS